MNRSSPTRAEIRLSLALFTTLLFVCVGLLALTARSGTQSHFQQSSASLTTGPQVTAITNPVSGVANLRQLANPSALTKVVSQSGAIDLVATQGGYRLQNKSGDYVDITAGNFWSGVAANNPYDCRAEFDPAYQRWIVTALAEPRSLGASVLIGISQNADISGNFFEFKVPARLPSDSIDLNTADSIALGFDAESITISFNLVSDVADIAPKNRSIVIDYPRLLKGQLAGNYFTGLSSSAVEGLDGPSSTLVISQVYGGGGNSGATYTNDFIELFNLGSSPVDVTGWSVQYASATGTGSWSVTPLTSVMIQPGQYYLVQELQGAGGTTPLPTPDAIGTDRKSTRLNSS